MGTIKELLQEKGEDVWFVEPGVSLLKALQTLAEHNVGALLVMKDGALAGIFSERDYARNSILKGNSCIAGTVDQLMTREVYCVSPDDTLDDCLVLMTEKHIRHLPVLDGDRVIGMLTLGDVVKKVIAHQEGTIRELEKFIAGGPKA